MAGLEFAHTSEVAKQLTDHIKDQLRLQLGLDFALIVSYAAMLASYCVAAAKLLWLRRDNLNCKFERDRQTALANAEKEKKAGGTPAKVADKPDWPIRLFSGLLFGAVVAGFVLAGSQWIAAIADASENVGLLLYLKAKPLPDFNGLELAYCSATVKFWLIGLGGAYSVVGFLFGAWTELRPSAVKPTLGQILLRLLFAVVGILYVLIAGHSLSVCRPDANNCPPKFFFHGPAKLAR
jgi:hypothetical protein